MFENRQKVREVDQRDSTPFGFYALILFTSVVMISIPRVDYQWTLFLNQHKWLKLSEIMGRTLFEGEQFGAADVVFIFMIVIIAAYLLACVKSDASWFRAWRPQLGFIVTTVLTVEVFLVQSVKWVMGRARPYLVLHDGLPFTQWYEFGPHFISDGSFRGSFPSGHTAVIFMLMTVAYILFADPSHQFRRRTMGGLCAGFTLVYSLGMGIGRCMTLSHWVSDFVGMIFLSWIIQHALYFWILRVPDQRRFYIIHGQYPNIPRFWELRLCGNMFFVFLGLAGTVIGIRALLIHQDQRLAMTALAGLLLVMFFGGQAKKLNRRVFGSFLPTPPCRPLGATQLPMQYRISNTEYRMMK